MNEAEIVLTIVIKPIRNPAKVMQPSKQSLHFPATAITTQRTTILRRWLATLGSMWSNHLDPGTGQFCIERIRVISLIADQAIRQFVGKGFKQSFSDKGDFMRRSRLRVDGERKTSAVCHRHELRTFAPLGLSHSRSPFFATMNVPSMKHSLRSNSPRSLRSWARV